MTDFATSGNAEPKVHIQKMAIAQTMSDVLYFTSLYILAFIFIDIHHIVVFLLGLDYIGN